MKADIIQLAKALEAAHENLEADLVALSKDASYEGVLVVTSWPESLDLSWLLCCSVPGSCPECKKGDFRPRKEQPSHSRKRQRRRND